MARLDEVQQKLLSGLKAQTEQVRIKCGGGETHTGHASCVVCGACVSVEAGHSFRDTLSSFREFQISKLCQACQDRVFEAAPAALPEVRRMNRDRLTAALREIEERERIASDVVDALDHGTRKWAMSIPARPNYDPDILISASLQDVPRLLAVVKMLAKEMDWLDHDEHEVTPRSSEAHRGASRMGVRTQPLGEGEQMRRSEVGRSEVVAPSDDRPHRCKVAIGRISVKKAKAERLCAEAVRALEKGLQLLRQANRTDFGATPWLDEVDMLAEELDRIQEQRGTLL